MIRTAVPGVSVKIVVWPAAISPTTGRCTGRSAVASATSRNATAYPSMPELSKTRERHLGTDVVGDRQPDRVHQRMVERLHRLDPGSTRSR